MGVAETVWATGVAGDISEKAFGFFKQQKKDFFCFTQNLDKKDYPTKIQKSTAPRGIYLLRLIGRKSYFIEKRTTLKGCGSNFGSKAHQNT
jgi:hypothetical protein